MFLAFDSAYAVPLDTLRVKPDPPPAALSLSSPRMHQSHLLIRRLAVSALLRSREMLLAITQNLRERNRTNAGNALKLDLGHEQQPFGRADALREKRIDCSLRKAASLELLASEYGPHPTVVGPARARGRFRDGASVGHLSILVGVTWPGLAAGRAFGARRFWEGVVNRRPYVPSNGC